MKKIILLILIGCLISCKSKSDIKKVEVLFTPSFLYPTKFTIDIEKKTIEQYKFQDKYYVTERIDSNSYRKHRKDTLVIYYQKTFPIENQILKKFLRELKASQLDSTIRHQKAILDGIRFRISKILAQNDTISLLSNISWRSEESELEYKLLDAFFELSNKSIDDYVGVSGIENIQDYFSYGLPIKKVSETPIEFRIWGSISGCRSDNQEFLTFLKKLPLDKPVIFDLRNGSIAYCLNEVLEEFSQKKQLFLYGDKSMSESKEIMDEIKLAEKNGEVFIRSENSGL